MNIKERIKAKVTESETGCWEWIAGRFKTGYGQLWYKGKNCLAHRVSYEVHKGKITKGSLVRHTCDNPKCVNPDHLELGTQKDNIQDCIKRNRRGSRPITEIGMRALTSEPSCVLDSNAYKLKWYHANKERLYGRK